MAMTDHKITENMMENKQVTDAPDQPQGTAQQNKYLFDRLAKEVIIPAFNALINSLTSAGGADIGVSVPGVSGTTVQAVLNSMKTLIDGRYTKAQSDANLKNKTDPLIKSVGLDPQTGIWTFTKENGQTVKVDTNLEKIALDAKLDPETKEFVLTLADGTEQRVSLSSFVRFLEFVSSDEIEFTTTGNTVKAGIKSGSIAEDKLNTALFSRLDTAVASAESNAANAQTYAQNAQIQATNAAGSAVDAGIDAHNAETWTEGGQLMSEGGTLLPEHTTGAKEYAQMAQNSAGQAASSAANADTSKNAAAESAQRAEEAAKQAEEIAGGDFVTRSEFSLHTGDQEKHVTKEERTAWNAKLDEAKRGKAGGVASLDAQGKVPAGQLPEMNYDPVGSAQAVQQALNTHAANKTLHVTAAERQAWNNKAPGTHTHTAAQVGALPISGGTMTGALNMNGKALTNLPTPKNNKDAVPKDYVDVAVVDKPYKLLEKIISSKSWTCPDGVILISALIVGGGGGGGGAGDDGSAGYGGGGQGGACLLVRDIKVTPGQSYQIVVGTGGNGGSGGERINNLGTKGGDTIAFGFTAIGGDPGGKDVRGENQFAGSFGGKPRCCGEFGGIEASYFLAQNLITPKEMAERRYIDLLYEDWYGSGGAGGGSKKGAPNAGYCRDYSSGTAAPSGFGGGGGGGTFTYGGESYYSGGKGGSGAVLIYVRGE